MLRIKKWIGYCLLTATSFQLWGGPSEIVYDYIIVGNGTAGAVLARKLSDGGKNKVLVLEAGTNHDQDPVALNAQGDFSWLMDLTQLLSNPTYAATYNIPIFNIPLLTTSYSEGRGWGGSSMHNFMQGIRGTPEIYDEWATLSGNSMWNYNNVLPLMLSLENFTPDGIPFNPTERGSGGPISLTQFPPITTNSFIDGFLTALGSSSTLVDDCNDPTYPNIGFSSFQMFATPGPSAGTMGVRSFSSREFLDSVVNLQGRGTDGRLLRIASNAFVNRVLFKGKKAIGVEFVYGDTPNKALQAFGNQIILCAGGINSPAILQRSGIGPASLLNSLGIEVLVDNPNVGANLVNQYGPTAIVVGASAPGDAEPFFQGFANGFSTGGLSSPYDNYPDDQTRRLQIMALTIAPGISQVITFLLNPQSRGNLQIVSTNPMIQPKIDLNMYSDGGPSDANTDANLAVTTYQLISQSVGGAVIYPPASSFMSPDDLLAAAKQLSGLTVSSHITGTTQMATSIEAGGVVDGNLRVFGVDRLMVVDLGSVPRIPDGNTCYCVYVLALGAAKILGVSTPPAL